MAPALRQTGDSLRQGYGNRSVTTRTMVGLYVDEAASPTTVPL
jgi:hypothetical protein